MRLRNRLQELNKTVRAAAAERAPIAFDEPTFIRMLEWARESAPGDEALHIMLERADKMRGNSAKVFTMAEYPELVKGLMKQP